MAMTAATLPQRILPAARISLFALTMLFSAALVFSVEPMIAKMLLPSLGGAPSVWNTSLAFFQAALLAGYAYAHLLQRMRDVRWQIVLHLALLMLASLTLPLAISGQLGAPNPNAPIPWLLGELTLSLGPTFALLSATAPLLQRWFASGSDPDVQVRAVYPLYAASNVGSLTALLAYPLIVEPLFTLTEQRIVWSASFAVFIALLAGTAAMTWRSALPSSETASVSVRPRPRDLLVWTILAAVPSSLMMGVTTYVTTDIASFPFLWVLPLALYLLTFILAFGRRASWESLAPIQCVLVVACLFVLPTLRLAFGIQVVIHLATFFVSALLCHRMLAERRPGIEHLTAFYLCLSAGGVLGGAFNAFVAPVIFDTVIEYPLVLFLACLARPWSVSHVTHADRVLFAIGIVAAFAPMLLPDLAGGSIGSALFVSAAGCALLLRRNASFFVLIVGVAWLSSARLASRSDLLAERSFFGVLRVSEVDDPSLGPVRMMYHGTTIHGGQALSPSNTCRPLAYYAPATPLGQTFVHLQAERQSLRTAVIGLGTGALASYVRPQDRMSFFEIDPLVVRHARDSGLFSYLTQCSKAPVDIAVGDARLTLANLPDGELDLLVVDAFSSDAVPAHLLTVEAFRSFFAKLRPDGVLLLNLTNRHLELRDIVAAGLRAVGATSFAQRSTPDPQSPLVAAATTGLVASRSEAALASFRADQRWSLRDPGTTQPWTDDYSNLLGAVMAGRSR